MRLSRTIVLGGLKIPHIFLTIVSHLLWSVNNSQIIIIIITPSISNAP